MSSQRAIARVARSFDAAPERVFDAWLDPALIGRWMFGPALRDETVLRINVDPRVGGAFSFAVLRQGEELDHVGEYLELERPRRLAFTWGVGQGDSSTVRVDIVPVASGCEVGLTHELHPDWAAFVQRSEEAWSNMLGALASLLTSDA